MLLLLNREVREVEKEASDCEERLQGWKDQLEAAERWVLVFLSLPELGNTLN